MASDDPANGPELPGSTGVFPSPDFEERSTGDVQQLKSLYDQFWEPGFRSISLGEARFINGLIAFFRPKHFLEIGMASGFSTGIIARGLEANGGRSLLSIDHDDTFFADTKKRNGFIFDEIYNGDVLKVELKKFTISPDLRKTGKRFDMAFVDANHQHPWPTIDMMCVWPFMTGKRIMIHHDLRLFRHQKSAYLGIGPKFLYDQFPGNRKINSASNNGNTFALHLDMSRDDFETILSDLFMLPWSHRLPIQRRILKKLRLLMKNYYSPSLLNHFEECVLHKNENSIYRPTQCNP